MWHMRTWSISTRLFALQLVFITALAGIATGWLVANARSDVESEAAARCTAVASSIAANPFVRDALANPAPSTALQPYALDLVSGTGTDFVTIMAPDRTRYTHPNAQEIGRPFVGTIAPALAGKTFTETYTGTLGPSVRAVVPITDATGQIIGIVAVGVTLTNIMETLQSRLPFVIGAALLTILAGGVASWLLSRYLRRVTWGQGPEEIARMFAYYEGVLHSVREGLVLVDPQSRIVLYNDQAAELLGLPLVRPSHPVAVAVTVADLDLSAELRALLAGGQRAVDEVFVTENRVLVVNQEPAVSTDARRASVVMGTVTTLRDHTEVLQLAGELESLRTLSDALSSQTHEFANRLHTIVALIELDRGDEAVRLAATELDSGQELTDQLVGSIDEPVLAALLLGKSAQARERGIALVLDIAPDLGTLGLDSRDLVTIIGNLLDNAMDACLRGAGEARVTIAVARESAGKSTGLGTGPILVEVSDSGPGVLEPQAIFRRGFTTKQPDSMSAGANSAGLHGVGLALVGQSVRRLGGTIDVESRDGATFTVRIPG
jgi:two-component system CitB family sensor kinase